MYHPRLKGNPYAMGRKMGEVFKKSRARFPVKLDPFQVRFGRESGKLLKRLFPEAAEEIRGVTDVLGWDNTLFTSWMMCMGCCLDLQHGHDAETRGCTAFSFTRKGRVYHARNNDLPLFLKKVSKSILYRPGNRISFILNTSSFINGEEGMNQYGLAAAMTFVKPRRDEIKPGINSVFLVRYLLENCRTVDEGLKALKRLPAASSCNIILTDRNGKMAVAECHPFRMHVRQPEKAANGGHFIVTVNHFTSEEMQKHDASNGNLFFADARYRTACRALRNTDYRDGLEHAKKILSGKYGFMCQYGKELDFDTIWSSIFDISRNRVFRAEGNPSEERYIEDTRLDPSRLKSAEDTGL